MKPTSIPVSASGSMTNSSGPLPPMVTGTTSGACASGSTSGNVQRSPGENPGGAPITHAGNKHVNHTARTLRRYYDAPMRALVLVAALSTTAYADDVLHPGTPETDPPTITALGVGLPITGDDNFTAQVAVRYRVTGTTAWHDALPLARVHAEVVTGLTVGPGFAGSIFDLAPDTSYDIELHATAADGSVDQTLMLTAKTRPVPGDPASPHAVAVTTAQELTAAH